MLIHSFCQSLPNSSHLFCPQGNGGIQKICKIGRRGRVARWELFRQFAKNLSPPRCARPIVRLYAVTVFANLPCPRNRHELRGRATGCCHHVNNGWVGQISLFIIQINSSQALLISPNVRFLNINFVLMEALRRIARDSWKTYRPRLAPLSFW